jgi:hypothetical protein
VIILPVGALAAVPGGGFDLRLRHAASLMPHIWVVCRKVFGVPMPAIFARGSVSPSLQPNAQAGSICRLRRQAEAGVRQMRDHKASLERSSDIVCVALDKIRAAGLSRFL